MKTTEEYVVKRVEKLEVENEVFRKVNQRLDAELGELKMAIGELKMELKPVIRVYSYDNSEYISLDRSSSDNVDLFKKLFNLEEPENDRSEGTD